ILDIILPAVDRRDLILRDVETDRLETRLGDFHGQRKSDIAQADHGGGGRPLLDLLGRLFHAVFHNFADSIPLVKSSAATDFYSSHGCRLPPDFGTHS